MEETEKSNANKKCTPKGRSFSGRTNPNDHQLFQYPNPFRFSNQNQYRSYSALLPPPPPIPLQPTATPPLPQNQNFRSKAHLQKPSWKHDNPPRATSSDTQVSLLTVSSSNTILEPSSFLYAFLFFYFFLFSFSPHLYKSTDLNQRKPTFLVKGIVIFWICHVLKNSVEWHSIMYPSIAAYRTRRICFRIGNEAYYGCFEICVSLATLSSNARVTASRCHTVKVFHVHRGKH